jgi:hypothetical protein
MEEPTTVVGGTSRPIPDELVDELLAVGLRHVVQPVVL